MKKVFLMTGFMFLGQAASAKAILCNKIVKNEVHTSRSGFVTRPVTDSVLPNQKVTIELDSSGKVQILNAANNAVISDIHSIQGKGILLLDGKEISLDNCEQDHFLTSYQARLKYTYWMNCGELRENYFYRKLDINFIENSGVEKLSDIKDLSVVKSIILFTKRDTGQTPFEVESNFLFQDCVMLN